MKNPTKLQFSLKAQIIHITSYDFDTRHGITKIDHADIVKGEDTKMGIPLSRTRKTWGCWTNDLSKLFTTVAKVYISQELYFGWQKWELNNVFQFFDILMHYWWYKEKYFFISNITTLI